MSSHFTEFLGAEPEDMDNDGITEHDDDGGQEQHDQHLVPRETDA